MGGTVLRKLPDPPTSRSDGRFLRYDPGQGGYLAAVQGRPGEVVTVLLDLMVPIRRDGTRATLSMLAPRTTKSRLVLVSSSPIQSVVASEGILLSTDSITSGGVRLEAEGLGGEFSLSWIDRPVLAESSGSVLSASSEVLVSIDGRDVRNLAKITVQGFGQSFREFTVRLPPGARYVPQEFAAPIESVEVVGGSSSTGEEAAQQEADATEVRVVLTADQTDPVTLQIQTIQSLNGSGNGVQLELTGFEVVGAVPQDGQLGIEVDDAWQLRCEPSDGVRLVLPSELDFSWARTDAPNQKLTAAMRFARQPWKLPIKLAPREERLIATPSYELHIGPDHAELRMEVPYRLEGTRAARTLFTPRFALEGWEHVSTTTVNVEDVQEVVDQADTIAFENAVATSQRPVGGAQLPPSLARKRQPSVCASVA